jgi:hypothetical protein
MQDTTSGRLSRQVVFCGAQNSCVTWRPLALAQHCMARHGSRVALVVTVQASQLVRWPGSGWQAALPWGEGQGVE